MLFDTKMEGHIEFGKAMLNEMDSVAPDSTITLATKASVRAAVTGPLHLDYSTSFGSSQKFWEEVEYYWLSDKQGPIQDSIVKFSAEIERIKALQEASTQFVEATAEQIKIGEKELSHKKYAPFTTLLDSLKTVNTKIDASFELIRTGQTLSENDKKAIADMTTDGSKLKKELKKETEGQKALEVFEKISKAYAQNSAAKKQYDALVARQKEKETSLKAYQNEAARINERVRVLKKILKL